MKNKIAWNRFVLTVSGNFWYSFIGLKHNKLHRWTLNIQWYDIDRNVQEKLSIYKEFDWCQDILFVFAFAYHCISHVSSPIYNFHISITGFCVLCLYKTGPEDRLNYNINNFVFAIRIYWKGASIADGIALYSFQSIFSSCLQWK